MAALTAHTTFDPRDLIAPVDRRLFGSFVEHMGRCVYSGVFEPGHPAADGDGFRTDVLDLVRELGVTVVRYPGGNFVSGYHWEDGVGPVGQRPARLDLAWHSRETNAFGLDEFVRWTRKAGVTPMLALNLGTRGIREALDLLEYANHPRGTALSDRRVAYGSVEPYDIRMWCLGNELDGPWQLGHKTPEEYARLAAETARAMRQLDPHLELVACGSSSSTMPTFGTWETVVLEAAYDLVDYISLHAYYEEDSHDLASFLASGADMDRSIEKVAALADEVGARAGSSKRVLLSVDEWNVWFLSRDRERGKPAGWPEAPRISEDAYSVADAVVVGSLLISFLKHADRVGCACLAQLVNAIAPIRTEPGGPAWREATFYPFALTAANARGQVVRLPISAPSVETARYGAVPVVDAVATIDEDEAAASLFVVNRHPEDGVELSVRIPHARRPSIVSASVVSDPDIRAVNTQAAPLRVRPAALRDASLRDGTLMATLPPVSWAVLRVELG